jgi:chemotaxis signal transduction protein
MKFAHLPIAERAAAMRREFDQGFADPPRTRQGDTIDLLAIRLGGRGHALRLSDIGGLFTDKPLTPLPNVPPGFLGLAGFRGKALSVFDLGRWLGHPASGPMRWGVIAAGQAAAFAFEGFEGHLRAATQDIVAPEDAASRTHIAGLLRHPGASGGETRRVIDLSSVLDALRQASASALPPSLSE